MPSLSEAYAYVSAHGPAIALFLLIALPSVITGLSDYPKAAGLVSFLRVLLNLLSVVTHRDSPGTFKVPLLPGRPPDGVPPAPRGFLRLPFLALVLIALPARADDPPRAVPALPQVAESDTPPPTRAFGGCNRPGTICFGPSVAVTMSAWDFAHDTVVAGFNPGIGYGVTFFQNRWYSCGLDYFLSMQTGPQAGVAQALLAKVANGYVRIGIARQLLGGQKTFLLPVGFGLDL